MGDQISRGEELVKKAEKKLNGWGFFGSKYYDAAYLLHKAVDCFELTKSWDRVGAVYVKLASCHLKLDHKHEAARAYDITADYYKMTKNLKEAISCLEKATHLFLDIKRLNATRGYYQILHTTFLGTRECKFPMGLAAAIDKRDVAEFTSCLKEYDSIIKLDEWRTLVLLKVKEALKVKALESKGQLGRLFYIVPCSLILFCMKKIRLF
uniref:Alpha-soluble NSF attachment protein n=1 Tax=Solanum tuberosum TaxID=4113 RepID=M1BF97_SOLTU